MTDDAERLTRLIHAVRQREPLASDLGLWIVKLATSSMPAAQREHARNSLLRKAASLVKGSRWRKTTTLVAELKAVRDEWTLHANFPRAAEGLTALIVEALFIDPDMPSSRRHILRILDENEDAESPTA